MVIKADNLETIKTDVVVLGSGAAGLRAAVEARSEDVSVLLVSRSKIGLANNTAISFAGLATSEPSSDPNDSPRQHYEDTLRGGCQINQPQLVQILTQNIPKEIDFLEQIGVRFLKAADGNYKFFARGGHSFPRRISTLNMIGRNLTKPLWECAKKNSVLALSGLTALKILVVDQRFGGLLLLNHSGQIVLVKAKAIVLAAGGGGAIYKNTTNMSDALGDGYGLAYEAGLPLMDMEFIQFILTHIHEAGVPPRIPPYEELLLKGAVFRDQVGKILLGDKDPRNVTRSMWMREAVRVIENRDDEENFIVMDLAGLSETLRNEILHRHTRGPAVSKNLPTRDHIKYKPAAHYFMGGIRVNPDMTTSIAGFFVAGEAMSGVHGADRLGGNSLADTMVFGRLAGQKAAGWARSNPSADLTHQELAEACEVIRCHLDTTKGNQDYKILSKQIRETISKSAGVVRTQTDMEDALAQIMILKREAESLVVRSATEFKNIVSLKHSAATAAVILQSALVRKESRGAHFRKDFPDQDKCQAKNVIIQKGIRNRMCDPGTD